LAYEWLLKRITEEPSVPLFRLEEAVGQATTVLNRKQRLSVLRALQRPLFGSTSLALQLVGDDLDFYYEVLGDKGLSEIHLAPLAGRPTGTWPQKAKLALSAGYSPEEVAYAAYSNGLSWSGSESAMWRTWEEQFANLSSHKDTGVRATAEVGHTYARQRREEALKNERLESIYGR
jgi:hypothetical protein